jgi:rubredoxin
MSTRPKKYRCTICGHIYDPVEGDPGSEVPPGTLFENLPDSWVCSDCGAMKADFEPMDE